MAIEISEAAQDDLIGHYMWLVRKAGLAIAEDMLSQADQVFKRLIDHPSIGSPVQVQRTGLSGLRKWRVTRFPNLLIFYVDDQDRLRIVRVLHAAQEWLALIEVE